MSEIVESQKASSEANSFDEAEKCDLNIHQKILCVMADAQYVTKDSTVSTGSGSYKAASHNAIKACLRVPMIKWGLSHHYTLISAETETRQVMRGSGQSRYEISEFVTTANVSLKFINVDKPDETLVVNSTGTGIDSGDKHISKATTNAVKQALINTFNLPVGESDETPYDEATVVMGEDVREYATEEQIETLKSMVADSAEKEDEKEATVKRWENYMVTSGMLIDGRMPLDKYETALKQTKNTIENKKK